MMCCRWRKMSFLIKNERGTVAVEAAFYFVIFFMFCALLFDFSTVFINKGHLERINYSLASILRDRSRFYDDREELSQKDVIQLDALAAQLLKDSRIGSHYQLLVEAIYFKEDVTAQELKLTQSFSSGSADCGIQDRPLDLNALSVLSPYGSDEKRWLPVYLITICVPGGESLFRHFLNLGDPKLSSILISNAVVPRFVK